MKYTIARREEWSSIEKEPFFTLCRGICRSLRKNSIPVRTVSLSGIIMDLPFIDTSTAPRCFSCFLEDVDIRPIEISRRLCGRQDCFVLRSLDCIDHIFSGVYPLFERNVYPGKTRVQQRDVQEYALEKCQKAYLKVKFLELLIVLNGR